MKDSLLLQTITAFSPTELQEIKDFLASPLFNTGSHANQNLALFTHLAHKIKEKKEEAFTKSMVSHAVFGYLQQGNNLHYLENRMSELMVALRKFICWKEMTRSFGPVFESIAVARFYRDHDLGERQEQALSKARSLLNETEKRSENAALLNYWLEEEVLRLESYRNQRKGNLNISESLAALTDFFGARLLEISMALVQQERVNAAFQSSWKPIVQKFRQVFKEENLFNSPTVLVLEEALSLLENKKQASLSQFEGFLNILNQYEDQISFKTVQNLAAYARNFCLYKSNTGDKYYIPIQVTLYKQHLQKGWLYEYGRLLPSTFINMVILGLAQNELKWVTLLLEEFAFKIAGNNQDRVIDYCYARYHFHGKNYQNASDYLQKILQSKKFNDEGLEKLVRIMEIKALYEMKDELIGTQLYNYLMFLRRNPDTLTQERRDVYMNFVKIMNQFLKLHEKIAEKKLNSIQMEKAASKIKTQIETPSFYVAEKTWLLEKVNEFF